MEEKKTIKISVSTFFLIIAIIAICVMGFFIYKLNNDKLIEQRKSSELQSQVTSLNGTVNELQGKINSISSTINSNSSADTNVTQNKQVESTTTKVELDKKYENFKYPFTFPYHLQKIHNTIN